MGDDDHSDNFFFSSPYGGGGGEGGADRTEAPLAPAYLGLAGGAGAGTSGEVDARAMRWGDRKSEKDAARLRPCLYVEPVVALR